MMNGMMHSKGLKTLAGAAGLAATLTLGACGDDLINPLDPDSEDAICDLPEDLLFASLPPDAIPALTLPDMVDAHSPDVSYLLSSDRVLGVVIDGEARAYPHNILWHHEIVNDRIGDTWVSVSFCPLTGSGLAFDPHVDGTQVDLGVSGLLFANNLVLFDRVTGDVYGPQLEVEGKCSSFRSAELDLMPVQEMSWAMWKSLHPDTKVVSGNTGFSRPYRSYPYGSYDLISDGDLLFPMTVDRTRPIKERVLAIRTGPDIGRGYPFGELKDIGEISVVNEDVAGQPVVVFYSAANGETALAFDARVEGQTLTFDVVDDTYTDLETGSTWTIDGRAITGPLTGEALQQHPDSYTLFWFAWQHFQPGGTTFTR